MRESRNRISETSLLSFLSRGRKNEWEKRLALSRPDCLALIILPIPVRNWIVSPIQTSPKSRSSANIIYYTEQIHDFDGMGV